MAGRFYFAKYPPEALDFAILKKLIRPKTLGDRPPAKLLEDTMKKQTTTLSPVEIMILVQAQDPSCGISAINVYNPIKFSKAVKGIDPLARILFHGGGLSKITWSSGHETALKICF